MLNRSCTSSAPSLTRPFSKPPNPAIRQISLCHPRNAGDNYRLSMIQGLSSHSHNVDPTVHIPTIEGKAEVKRAQKRQGRGCAGGKTWFQQAVRIFCLLTQNRGWSKAILPFNPPTPKPRTSGLGVRLPGYSLFSKAIASDSLNLFYKSIICQNFKVSTSSRAPN